MIQLSVPTSHNTNETLDHNVAEGNARKKTEQKMHIYNLYMKNFFNQKFPARPLNRSSEDILWWLKSGRTGLALKVVDTTL